MLNRPSCVFTYVAALRVSSRQQVTQFKNSQGTRKELRVDTREQSPLREDDQTPWRFPSSASAAWGQVDHLHAARAGPEQQLLSSKNHTKWE